MRGLCQTLKSRSPRTTSRAPKTPLSPTPQPTRGRQSQAPRFNAGWACVLSRVPSARQALRGNISREIRPSPINASAVPTALPSPYNTNPALKGGASDYRLPAGDCTFVNPLATGDCTFANPRQTDGPTDCPPFPSPTAKSQSSQSNTYRGSYSTLYFFNNETYSCSNVHFR